MNLVDECIKEAIKSTYSHKVGAIIYQKNKIISRGHNYAQRGAKSITKRYLKWPWSIHAEIDAILKAKTDLKNKSIIVVRINKKGELRLAKPCSHCEMYLKHVGIKKVTYSSNIGLSEIKI